MRIRFLTLLLFCGAGSLFAQKSYEVKSPDNKLQAVVNVDKADGITISISHDGTEVLAPSPISMTLANGTQFGVDPKVSKVSKKTVNQTIPSPFYKKNEVNDNYNELTINFKGNYGLICRAYDEGIAYRFFTKMKDSITVQNETAAYNFSSDHKTFTPYVNTKAPTFEEQFSNSFEQPYVFDPITKLNSKRLIILPMLVELDNGKKLCITEADLKSYPGMFLNNSTDKPALNAMFAPYPKSVKQGGHNNLQMLVQERENYIARTNGTRDFPWRVFAVSDNDKDLLNCDMVYKLATPNQLSDISWIKPGKVAWDWWNDWNLYGVDFRAGINNDTYKYYIDFASKNGIEYVILDEGWAVNKKADLFQVIPEIDIQELVNYGKDKNVGIILWAGYRAFDRDMEKVCKHYSDMGVKGFKVDFMDRDDQEIIDFFWRAAEMAAKYNMLLDFHGACKPSGLQRTYPNVINYEGVHGLEQMKWEAKGGDMVKYDVSIPFIRQIAGPMDYTQGAMRNSNKRNYNPVYSEPMSQGTRCHQLATYVIFESPLNMLCDSPSNYEREEECTEFIANIPTVWEETVPLDSEVGEYVSVARRKGNDWYVGSMTNWTPREVTLDLSFLPDGNYKVELFKDGINADRAARDYKKEVVNLPADKKLKINMAPGGGYAAKIYK